MSRERFPAVNQLSKLPFPERSNEKVNMVRHDHKIPDFVSGLALAEPGIEKPKGVGNHFPNFRITKETITETCVGPSFDPLKELPAVDLPLLFRPGFRVIRFPLGLFSFPLIKLGKRYRIIETEGDEVSPPRLFPVREVALPLFDLSAFIEREEVHWKMYPESFGTPMGRFGDRRDAGLTLIPPVSDGIW